MTIGDSPVWPTCETGADAGAAAAGASDLVSAGGAQPHAARAEAASEIPTAQDRANYGNSQAGSQAAPSTVSNVAPAPALRADEAEQIREQSYANAPSQATASESEDSVVPAPAQRADEAEQIREQAYSNQDE